MDPIRNATEMGTKSGAAIAQKLVDKARKKPKLVGTLASDLEQEIISRARRYARDGWSKDMGMAWQEAFMASADPIMRAFFDEVEAETA